MWEVVTACPGCPLHSSSLHSLGGESLYLSCTSPFGPAKRLSVKCNSAQRAPQNTDTKTQPPRLKMTWHVQFLFKFNSLEEGETDDLQ